MFWVVQNNLYNEYGYFALVTALERMDIPYANVKVAPIIDRLIPGDFDTHAFKGDAVEMPEAAIDDSGLVMVCGTQTLARIAQKNGWQPGSFLNDNFHFLRWSKHYGDNLLNAGATVEKLGDLMPNWDTFFIRPCDDNKAFSGTVMSAEDFDNWRNKILQLGSDSWNVSEDTEVIAAPMKEIYAEYRFFVVDGEIITASRYKMGHRVIYSADVSAEAISMAAKMIKIWQPARAFVIDIADTPDGPKVIEINNLNSAGFYACNVGKIVEAIENMFF